MGEIATHAGLLAEHVRRRLVGATELVAESDVAMDKSGDGLHARPSLHSIAEQRPSLLDQVVAVTIPAGQEVGQNVVGQILNGVLARVRHLAIGLRVKLDDTVRPHPRRPHWRNNTGDPVAKLVVIRPRRTVGRNADEILADQPPDHVTMRRKRQQHGCR